MRFSLPALCIAIMAAQASALPSPDARAATDGTACSGKVGDLGTVFQGTCENGRCGISTPPNEFNLVFSRDC
ncbi:hypothetical protein K505DRAFT_321233 [Melanomma pulvis-pyrius CBS 109.77]|uniref:Uncharacterized protein n=1 Tax=Melanomma pulvis-pyrius CBS 109.77 TaxID=1314802 RepID=A0A6A6XSG5_9PLEO|nr:hypothetical protein K505DRAFT_321233 [Melanomma pulvis-pyrius CBS 109.77]